jgi:molybdate transport system substrate-binding protein
VAFIILALATLVGVAAPASDSFAADVVVLTAGAFKPVLLDIAAAFQARTGNTLAIANDTARGVAARIVRGEEIDLAIAPTAAMDALAAQGRIVLDTVVQVGKSGIGVVVKKGAPLPDISSVEALKRTLLATPSFAYIDPGSGGSSGIHLAQLFDRLTSPRPFNARRCWCPADWSPRASTMARRRSDCNRPASCARSAT